LFQWNLEETHDNLKEALGACKSIPLPKPPPFLGSIKPPKLNVLALALVNKIRKPTECKGKHKCEFIM
jgi:hypothetical protein